MSATCTYIVHVPNRYYLKYNSFILSLMDIGRYHYFLRYMIFFIDERCIFYPKLWKCIRLLFMLLKNIFEVCIVLVLLLFIFLLISCIKIEIHIKCILFE